MPFIGVSPNRTYRRTDGTRTGGDVWTEADGAGVKILSSSHDVHDEDIASALNTMLMRDGGNQATAHLQMGGFTLTNMGNATTLNQAMPLSQVRNDAAIFGGTTTGTSTAYVCALTPPLSSYVDGMEIVARAHVTNTGPASLNAGGGARSIRVGGSTIGEASIVLGRIFVVRFNANGNTWDLINRFIPNFSAYISGFMGSNNAAQARSNLGLGTAAITNLGTSGANLGLLNTNNTYTGVSTFSATAGISSRNTAKAYGRFTGNASLQGGSSFNIQSVTHVTTGTWVVLYNDSLPNAQATIVINPGRVGGATTRIVSQTANGFEFNAYDQDGNLTNTNTCHFVVFRPNH